MSQPRLIYPTEIIFIAWRNLTRHVKVYAEFVAWMAALTMLMWAVSTVIRRSILDQAAANSLIVLTQLPASLILIALSAGVIDATAKALDRKTPHVMESLSVGFHKLVSLVWVSFLTSVILVIGPMIAAALFYSALRWAHGGWSNIVSYGVLLPLAAALLTAPPLVYVVRYAFATNFLVVDGVLGSKALHESRLLVAGRWWHAFVRLAIPVLFVLLLSKLTIAVVYLLVGSVLGNPALFFGQVHISTMSLPHTLMITVIPDVIYGFSVPLYAAANLVLWNDLKRKPSA